MIFCIITNGSVEELKELPECDVAVFGFNGLGEVDYQSELKGLSDKFEDVVRLSRSAKCGVLSACTTNSRGVLRKSVAVAERGKLLGISDMNHVFEGEEFKSGAGLGVYTVGGYKIGICIENDLMFPDTFKALSMCGCNAVVTFLEQPKNIMPAMLIRTYSYIYGVPVIMCAGNTAYYAEVTGEIATSMQSASLFDITPLSSYHLVTTRSKGMFSEECADY